MLTAPIVESPSRWQWLLTGDDVRRDAQVALDPRSAEFQALRDLERERVDLHDAAVDREVQRRAVRVLDRVRPAAVIAVDALAAGRLSRLLRTVQLADTGITPGAGVGNARAALNEETLGVPVIAVGVPTVVDGATLAHEISSQLGQPDCEALDDLSQPVMITTRDIDREVADISRMIGYAVNMALHPHLSVADIDLYLS